MNRNKKQLELLLITYFRQIFPSFPGGKLKSSESPDFVVSLKNKQQLGIELTRLNPGNLVSQTPTEIAETDLQNRVVKIAHETYEHHLFPPLFVKFIFSEKNKIDVGSEMMLAIKTVSIIRQKIKKRNLKSFFSIIINSSELPEEIEKVLLVHHPGVEYSVWERSNNLGISGNVIDDIQKAIQKKDEKLKLYQKKRLNAYWLVIFTDRLRSNKSNNLAELIIKYTYTSRFQQVFLFDLVNSDIYHLI